MGLKPVLDRDAELSEKVDAVRTTLSGATAACTIVAGVNTVLALKGAEKIESASDLVTHSAKITPKALVVELEVIARLQAALAASKRQTTKHARATLIASGDSGGLSRTVSVGSRLGAWEIHFCMGGKHSLHSVCV